MLPAGRYPQLYTDMVHHANNAENAPVMYTVFAAAWILVGLLPYALDAVAQNLCCLRCYPRRLRFAHCCGRCCRSSTGALATSESGRWCCRRQSHAAAHDTSFHSKVSFHVATTRGRQVTIETQSFNSLDDDGLGEAQAPTSPFRRL